MALLKNMITAFTKAFLPMNRKLVKQQKYYLIYLKSYVKYKIYLCLLVKKKSMNFGYNYD